MKRAIISPPPAEKLTSAKKRFSVDDKKTKKEVGIDIPLSLSDGVVVFEEHQVSEGSIFHFSFGEWFFVGEHFPDWIEVKEELRTFAPHSFARTAKEVEQMVSQKIPGGIIKNGPIWRKKGATLEIDSPLCGHSFSTNVTNLKKKADGKGCRICEDTQARKSKIHSHEEVKNQIEREKGYTLISSGEKTWQAKRIIKIRHECGHKYSVRYSNWNMGRRCPACSTKTESHASKKFWNMAKEIKVKVIKEKPLLKNPDTGMMLRADFYFPDHNLVVEIDGKQHFVPVEMWGGKKAFEEGKKRDRMKDDFCRKNNIEVIRVPLCNEKGSSLPIKKVEATLRQIIERIDNVECS